MVGALWEKEYPDGERYCADFDRAVKERLERVYYTPYSKWCTDHGVALTGHPAGPDDMGMLQYFHIPGQDIVWRYIEMYQDKALEGNQSTMAKCSSSAQRHYGRERNANECFGAYGWEFTYDEMRYLTNWLLVRGVNIVRRHQRQTANQQGGIISKEGPIHISNLALEDPKDGKPTRVGFKILDDGKKVRFAKRSGEVIPERK